MATVISPNSETIIRVDGQEKQQNLWNREVH